MRWRRDQNFDRPKIFIDDGIPRRDLPGDLLRPVSARIGFTRLEEEQQILRERSSSAQAQDDFLEISRLARSELHQARKRQRMFRFLHCGTNFPHHAERVGYSTQGARVQKGARGQFIAARFEGPEAREQIATIYCRDVARLQWLQCAQLIPIKKVAFETFETTHCFKRAEVARHQLIDRDITKIVSCHRRQHRKPDVRRRSTHKNFSHWRFLNVVWRQPGSLGPDKIIKISPSSSCDGAQEPPIVRGQNSAAPTLGWAIDRNYRHGKESPQKEK